MARCSRCDESFPLVERRRRYTLAPVEAAVAVEAGVSGLVAAGSVPAPALPSIDQPAAGGGADSPARFRITAEDLGESPAQPAGPTELTELPDLSDDLDLPGYEDALSRPLEDGLGDLPPEWTEDETTDEPAVSLPEVEKPRPRRKVRQLPAVLFLTTLGAGLAYYGSLNPQADTPTQTAIGAIAGLLGGWVVARWMARQQ
jgi:hypothetical protein